MRRGRAGSPWPLRGSSCTCRRPGRRGEATSLPDVDACLSFCGSGTTPGDRRRTRSNINHAPSSITDNITTHLNWLCLVRTFAFYFDLYLFLKLLDQKITPLWVKRDQLVNPLPKITLGLFCTHKKKKVTLTQVAF